MDNRELAKVIKVVSPNYGRIVTLEIVADETFLEMYINQICIFAEGLMARVVEVSEEEKKVQLRCPNYNIAEVVRKIFSQKPP